MLLVIKNVYKEFCEGDPVATRRDERVVLLLAHEAGKIFLVCSWPWIMQVAYSELQPQLPFLPVNADGSGQLWVPVQCDALHCSGIRIGVGNHRRYQVPQDRVYVARVGAQQEPGREGGVERVAEVLPYSSRQSVSALQQPSLFVWTITRLHVAVTLAGAMREAWPSIASVLPSPCHKCP